MAAAAASPDPSTPGELGLLAEDTWDHLTPRQGVINIEADGEVWYIDVFFICSTADGFVVCAPAHAFPTEPPVSLLALLSSDADRQIPAYVPAVYVFLSHGDFQEAVDPPAVGAQCAMFGDPGQTPELGEVVLNVPFLLLPDDVVASLFAQAEGDPDLGAGDGGRTTVASTLWARSSRTRSRHRTLASCLGLPLLEPQRAQAFRGQRLWFQLWRLMSRQGQLWEEPALRTFRRRRRRPLEWAAGGRPLRLPLRLPCRLLPVVAAGRGRSELAHNGSLRPPCTGCLRLALRGCRRARTDWPNDLRWSSLARSLVLLRRVLRRTAGRCQSHRIQARPH